MSQLSYGPVEHTQDHQLQQFLPRPRAPLDLVKEASSYLIPCVSSRGMFPWVFFQPMLEFRVVPLYLLELSCTGDLLQICLPHFWRDLG